MVIACMVELPDREDGKTVSDPHVVIELVLYVSPGSLPCARAERVMRGILEQYDARQVAFRVCDLTQDPEAASRDRIIFTPTLVKRSPPPHVWVLGDLARPEVVTDLLHLCGVTPVSATT